MANGNGNGWYGAVKYDDDAPSVKRGNGGSRGNGGFSFPSISLPKIGGGGYGTVILVAAVGVGGFLLYKWFTESMSCGTYEQLGGRATCTKNEDCVSFGDRDFICKTCGFLPSSQKKCVECGSPGLNVLTAFTLTGTADALACANAQGRRVGQTIFGGTTTGTTAGGANIGTPWQPTTKPIEVLLSPTTPEYQAACTSKLQEMASTVESAKARNSAQGSGATYLSTTCSPTTKNGAVSYRAVIQWALPNGSRIQTEATETPYEYAARSGISMSQLGLTPPPWWLSWQLALIPKG